MIRRRWSIPKFRTATLMLAIALIALALGSWRAYMSPSLVWRRAAHGPGRDSAWGEATGGKIACVVGLARGSTHPGGHSRRVGQPRRLGTSAACR